MLLLNVTRSPCATPAPRRLPRHGRVARLDLPHVLQEEAEQPLVDLRAPRHQIGPDTARARARRGYIL